MAFKAFQIPMLLQDVILILDPLRSHSFFMPLSNVLQRPHGVSTRAPFTRIPSEGIA
jgi:hypothetical protein